MSDLSKEQIADIVEATVIKTLGNMGINVTTPDARREFMEDAMYTRAWRKSVQRGAKIGLGTMLTIFITGISAMLWLGFQVMLGHHP